MTRYLIALLPMALGLALLFAGGAGWVNRWVGVAGLLIFAAGMVWAGRSGVAPNANPDRDANA